VSFNEEEKAYLQTQPLARLATVSGVGQPDVVPVGFEFDGSAFYIGGMDLLSTRKYRNVSRGSEKVALVIDDIVTVQPWTRRFVRVYGEASLVTRNTDSGSVDYLRIVPTMSWSWNLEGKPFGSGEFKARRVVHGGNSESAPQT
jgi:pyridoxamine 5'-phosphate oxidase family protein